MSSCSVERRGFLRFEDEAGAIELTPGAYVDIPGAVATRVEWHGARGVGPSGWRFTIKRRKIRIRARGGGTAPVRATAAWSVE